MHMVPEMMHILCKTASHGALKYIHAAGYLYILTNITTSTYNSVDFFTSTMMNYRTRKVTSLKELKPGDHIRVPGSKDTRTSFGFSSVSSGASLSSGASYASPGAASDDPARGVNYQPCDKKIIKHHLLVVQPIDDTRVQVIHKVTDGVKEEILRYRPEDVTVLNYESQYMGEEAVKRAREIMGWEESTNFSVTIASTLSLLFVLVKKSANKYKQLWLVE